MDLQWEEFDSLSQAFLLQSDNFQMSDYYQENMVDFYRFWKEVYPTIIIPLPPTTFPPLTEDVVKLDPERKLSEQGSLNFFCKRS